MRDDPTYIAAAFLDEVGRSYRAHKRMAEAAMAQVADDRFFKLLDAESNSLALLVKHIAGNLRSRFTDFGTSDGEKPDRHRDNEFIIVEADTREVLMQRWDEGWGLLFAAIGTMQPTDLTRTVTIRHEPHTILQAVNRSLNHIVYHVGQIVFLAKHLRAEGAGWQTLSVPRGQSEEFNAKMSEKLSAKFRTPTTPTQPGELSRKDYSGETK